MAKDLFAPRDSVEMEIDNRNIGADILEVVDQLVVES